MAKTLTVYLAADVSKLTRGLNTANGALGGFGNTLNNMLGPALIGAGVAAGAFAAKLAIDGVQAAIEDEAALTKLAKTLSNVGLAHDTEKVEEYIGALEKSLGIADDELRPAYDRLVRSIKDTEGANKALALALDISSGSGKSLDAVVQALGRAYDGNVSGLSRLGAGIDTAILKTGDMNQITASLSKTFSGQAQTAAQTYEGQTRRLATAFDVLKESFGTGLLTALGNTNDTTQNLIDTMEDLEPLVEGVGSAFGTFATTALNTYTTNLKQTTLQTDNAKTSTEGFSRVAKILGGFVADLGGSFTDVNSPLGSFIYLLGLAPEQTNKASLATEGWTHRLKGLGDAADYATGQVDDLGDAVESTYRDFIKFAQITAQSTKTTADQAERAQGAAERMADLSGAVDDYSRSSGSANSAADTTNKLLEGQQTLVGGLTTKLKAQTAELDNATAAVTSYVDSLAKQITQGFDLGTGFEMKDGAVDAAQWIAGVNSEVDKLTWYGNVLKRIKEEGGQGLADYLAAQGVEQGALYGQALIDTGLITTMADKLSSVQTQANLVAQAMVPEFLLAGQDSAEEFVNGTITQIALEEKRLRKIGQAIGQPIGANIKAEIAQAVAEAIRAAEAAGTAARAEVSARETARQVQLTEQATAQSLARLIRQSDQRAGVGVRPVLT